MGEFLLNHIEAVISVISAIVAVILGLMAIQRYFHAQKIERMEDTHKAEVASLNALHDKETAELQRHFHEERLQLRKTIEAENAEKNQKLQQAAAVPLIQEQKVVYVKYLHISRDGEKPVYQKYIQRTGETIDVFSEYHYYRFNKCSTHENQLTINDRSSGIVELNLLHPWKDLVFTDKPSQKIREVITQDIGGSEAYFSVTTYYNGFKENNEDLGMKMEMDTQCARLIADFSSILGVDKLFGRDPDVFKILTTGERVKLFGLEKIGEGIFHIEANNLKKNEVILLDFHVDWEYLKS